MDIVLPPIAAVPDAALDEYDFMDEYSAPAPV
jgi:hypothetical protein